MIRLENIEYSIASGSTLVGIIPNNIKNISITKVSDVYKMYTSETDKAKINGTITFDLDKYNNAIEFTYCANDIKVGIDAIEFTATYSDGSTRIHGLNISVKQKVDSTTTIKYLEIFTDTDTTKDLSLTTAYWNERNKIPTEVSISLSDPDFNTTKYTSTYNRHKTTGLIQTPSNKINISNSIEIVNINSLFGSIMSSKAVNLTFTKTDKYNGEEYCIIKFDKFVNVATGEDLKISEIYRIIFHARKINDSYIKPVEVEVKNFPTFSDATFVEMKESYPKEPENIYSAPGNKKKTYGDLLYNTIAHNEFDDIGNPTIRLGNRVPENAVNLGYYYNATSSLEDTVSVIETNTNTVTMHYVEDWIHKLGLDTNDEDYFPDNIQFEGEVGTELEGYWGILYRDYVMWEEEPLIDQEPKSVVHYERYNGISTKEIPKFIKYNADDKSGMLKLTNAIYTPIDFHRVDEAHKVEAKSFNCEARYEGLVKNNKVRYNGSAKYSGIVSKKDGMSNIDPEAPKEILMFPDANGTLYKVNGDELIEDDLFYITDKFKDDTPLYYKYKTKLRIYDSIGPDIYGNYNTESIKLVNENHVKLDETIYKYKVDIVATQYKNIYDCYVYTSFVPSVENAIYVMYDGIREESYIKTRTINPLDVEIGILEKISVIQAYDTSEYSVKTNQGVTRKSTITVNNPQIINDDRAKIKIKYKICCDGLETPSIQANVINKKYAISNELSQFINDEMIVSTKNLNGYMTAKDILFQYITDEDKNKITSKSIFKVIFDTTDSDVLYNKDKVLLYTNPNGSGLIMARTFVDTGLPNEKNTKNNLKLDAGSVYYSDGTKIKKCFSVYCRNINQIVISSPKETDPLKGWFPKVRYAYFDKVYERIDSTTQLIYSVPEFTAQVFGKYGKPYVDVTGETPRFIGKNTVKVQNYPLYVKINSNGYPQNITATKTLADGSERNLIIKYYNFEHGIIEFDDIISENDSIKINYTYEEQYYHYKGYYDNFDLNTKMLNLDLNPSMYNSFTDTKNQLFEQRNTYELFNRTIHFFLRPMRVINKNTGEVLEDNLFTLYHKFDNQESLGPFDLHIGRIFVRHHASLQSTKLIDTRSRGGGILESITDDVRRELEPESDYYLDIGTLDGQPYQQNSVIVARIDNRVLKINGGRFSEEDVKQCVEKWASYGTFPIIEFVEIQSEENMPNSNLIVSKNTSNRLPFKPYFIAEAEENSGSLFNIKKRERGE